MQCCNARNRVTGIIAALVAAVAVGIVSFFAGGERRTGPALSAAQISLVLGSTIAFVGLIYGIAKLSRR